MAPLVDHSYPYFVSDSIQSVVVRRYLWCGVRSFDGASVSRKSRFDVAQNSCRSLLLVAQLRTQHNSQKILVNFNGVAGGAQSSAHNILHNFAQTIGSGRRLQSSPRVHTFLGNLHVARILQIHVHHGFVAA